MKPNHAMVSSYEDYLEICSLFNFTEPERRIKDLLKLNKVSLAGELPFGTCLIDYSQVKYLYTSPNAAGITGYTMEDYSRGPLSQIEKMHPEDRVIFKEQVFPDIIHYLHTIPRSEYERYRFSFSYRFIRKDGSIAHLMQQSTYFEPTDDGNPLLNLVVFSDISPFKTDDRITLMIAYLTQNGVYLPVFRKQYAFQQQSSISERELQILKLSLEGMSSKLIADKLYLSIHTVKNHKRNMMDKTSSRNISELIHFAFRHKLID